VKLKRYDGNPILRPNPDVLWENICACNPGAWFDGHKVTLLYRAGPDTDEHPIFLGLAESSDGLNFKRLSDKPVFAPSENGFDAGCVEDPRIVKYGNVFFVTYAARMFYPGAYWRKTFALNQFNPPLPDASPRAARENLTRTGLAATENFRTWYRMGPITPATVDNRDVILFPEPVDDEYLMLHRPATWIGPEYGCAKPSIWLSYGQDLLSWREDHILAQPHFNWESAKIGGASPPIKTRHGWLVLYHGVDARHVYRVGAMVLDLEDPLKILGRTPEPILEPEMPYEKEGLVPNVVFPTGNVVINNELYVYYGGADQNCCLATAPLDKLVDSILAHPWNP
jgi:predicted GH43/DUF377 family glycosyl hydrolase